MRVITKDQLLKPDFDFSKILEFAQAHEGQWIELDAVDIPGPTLQDKQSRLLQAARKNGVKIKTRSHPSMPDVLRMTLKGEYHERA